MHGKVQMKKNLNRNEIKIVLLKLSLYCISLWILMFILIVLKIDIPEFTDKSKLQIVLEFVECNVFSFACFIIIILGLVGYWYFKDSLKNAKRLPVEVQTCESVNYENLSFLATYVIPLVCFPLKNKREIFVLFAVIVIIGCIFVKTNLYHTNPSLVLLGFNVYSVQCKDNKGFGSGIVIVRGRLEANDSIKYMNISDNVYFARRV